LSVGGRDVLLDGAHNPAGAAALATALDDLAPHLSPGRPTLVVATMADKDVDGIVAALRRSEALRGADVITTRVDAARALDAEELAQRWRTGGRSRSVSVVPEIERALATALERETGPVIVAGSLYLVGAVRARLVDDPLLRDDDRTSPR
jgi:dihydrofolate synthase/folylpolyglutamate synthase